VLGVKVSARTGNQTQDTGSKAQFTRPDPLNYVFEWTKLRMSDGVWSQPHAQCWYSVVTLFGHMDVHVCTDDIDGLQSAMQIFSFYLLPCIHAHL